MKNFWNQLLNLRKELRMFNKYYVQDGDIDNTNSTGYTVTIYQDSHIEPEADQYDEGKHQTEDKFPKQTAMFRRMVESMYKIHLDKNKDYSPSNILIAGEVGVLVRMWDKVSRLFNLFGLTFPCPEPMVDNLIDDIQNNGLDEVDVVKRLLEIKKNCSLNFDNIAKKNPSNETIEDTFKDLANYAIIGYLHSENSWGR